MFFTKLAALYSLLLQPAQVLRFVASDSIHQYVITVINDGQSLFFNKLNVVCSNCSHSVSYAENLYVAPIGVQQLYDGNDSFVLLTWESPMRDRAQVLRLTDHGITQVLLDGCLGPPNVGLNDHNHLTIQTGYVRWATDGRRQIEVQRTWTWNGTRFVMTSEK